MFVFREQEDGSHGQRKSKIVLPYLRMPLSMRLLYQPWTQYVIQL